MANNTIPMLGGAGRVSPPVSNDAAEVTQSQNTANRLHSPANEVLSQVSPLSAAAAGAGAGGSADNVSLSQSAVKSVATSRESIIKRRSEELASALWGNDLSSAQSLISKWLKESAPEILEKIAFNIFVEVEEDINSCEKEQEWIAVARDRGGCPDLITFLESVSSQRLS